jgi:hypothetical protein
MREQTKANRAVAMAWRSAWSDRKFRIKTVIGTILLFCLLAYLPIFFFAIEERQGISMNDYLLRLIPPCDVSIPTFMIIWSLIIFMLFRCAQRPQLLILFLYSFIILSLSRMLTITLLPLEPPEGLIPLKDPLIGIFYGGPQKFITKDLFYSGHTSVQFLIFLCLKKKKDKIVSLCATIAVAILVLVQHIHYTIDVLAAFIFTYLVYRIGKMITAI